MSSGFAFAFLVLISASMCLVAQTQPQENIWQSVEEAIDNFANFQTGAILVGSDDLGVVFNYTKGGWDQSQPYLVASASKWVSSTAIWIAIQRGKISIDDRASQWISWWTSDPADARSNVTLGNLLAFSSGLNGDTCSILNPNLTQCAQKIYDNGVTYNPGTRFYYGGDHHQVAGLMVLNAMGYTDWNLLFRDLVLTPLGISSSSALYLPPNCPNIAGGLRTDTSTYLKLLQAIYTNINPPLVNATTRALRERDWNSDNPIEYSPVSILQQEWHYASSFWVVCPFRNFNSTCNELRKYASPGKFGYVPYIDRIGDYWILLSTYSEVQYAFAYSTQLVLQIEPTVLENVLSLRGTSEPVPTGPPNSASGPTGTQPSSASGLSSALMASLAFLLLVAVMI